MDRNVKETGEEQYQNIFEVLEEGYFEVDLKGNYTFVNDAVCKNYGASRDELLGMNYKEYMDEKTAATVYNLFNQVYKTGNPFRLLEWEITKKDGSKAVEESSVYLIRNAAGKPIGFRGIVRDVPKRNSAMASAPIARNGSPTTTGGDKSFPLMKRRFWTPMI